MPRASLKTRLLNDPSTVRRPQGTWTFGRRSRGFPSRVRFGDEDLLEDEIQIGSDERNHFIPPAPPAVSAGQAAKRAGLRRLPSIFIKKEGEVLPTTDYKFASLWSGEARGGLTPSARWERRETPFGNLSPAPLASSAILPPHNRRLTARGRFRNMSGFAVIDLRCDRQRHRDLASSTEHAHTR